MSEPRAAAQRRLALALEEYRTRQDGDPLRTFQPHKKQKEFIEQVLGSTTKRLHWALWANRVGKSESGAWLDAHILRNGNPLAKPDSYGNMQVTDRAASGWVVSLDYKASRDTMQPKIFDNGAVPPGQAHAPFIPPREIKEWRASEGKLKLKNGSICSFMSCEQEASKFAAAGKDFIHFDEPPPKGIFQESLIRIEAGRPLLVYGTCTILPPEGQNINMHWIFEDFVNPWKEGKADYFTISTASIYENPHLGPEEITFLESIYPPGSIARRIRLDGELLPGAAGHRAYGNFDRQVHVRELGVPNTRVPLCWCWDFNVGPMITMVGQRYNRIFKFYDELVIDDDATIDAMVEMFYDTYGRFKAPIWIYGDQTSERRSVFGPGTSYTMITNHLKTHHIHAKLKLPTVNPPQVDRINAMNHALLDENKEPFLEVDPRCVEMIADLEGVQTDNRGGIKKSNKPDDPYFRRTHASDAGGYWVAYEAPVKPLSFHQKLALRMRDPGYAFRN